MRSRILVTTVLVTLVAVVSFGVPLGATLSRMDHDRAVLRLEREANRILATVSDEELSSGRGLTPPPRLYGEQGELPAAIAVGSYDGSGHKMSGQGPADSRLATQAISGTREIHGTEHGELAVVLPLRGDRSTPTAIRVAVPAGSLDEEVHEDWLLMAALGAGIVAASAVLAWLLARRLSAPLGALARDATLLGEGDFGIRFATTGVEEIDAAGTALETTARRLGRVLERERAFSADVSHQMRTPLTALRVALEAAPVTPGVTLDDVVDDAVAEVDRLETTLDHLIALTRDVAPVGETVFPSVVLEQLRERWTKQVQRQGRALEVDLEPELPAVRASAASLGHVLDVLVDNAMQHGAGRIGVRAHRAGTGVAVEVSDEGAGFGGTPDEAETFFRRRSAAARGTGIGLPLARSLAEADGGRLDVLRHGPRPVLRVLLVAANDEAIVAEPPEPAEPDPVAT